MASLCLHTASGRWRNGSCCFNSMACAMGSGRRPTRLVAANLQFDSPRYCRWTVFQCPICGMNLELEGTGSSHMADHHHHGHHKAVPPSKPVSDSVTAADHDVAFTCPMHPQVRQTAEWGMRMIQTSFPWLKDRFFYEERGEWRICLKMLVSLYNMRARMVGINQIRNTYMRHISRDANEDVFF